MDVPSIKKLDCSNDIFIERALPKEGAITARVGDTVEPYTKLGIAKSSFGELRIGPKIKVVKGKSLDSFFYKGDEIGKTKEGGVKAPFNGYLKKDGEEYVFVQEERDYILLAGVWGDVVNVVKDKSVMVKTRMTDIYLPVCTKYSFAGELLVFPNPPELLEMQYLEKFSKDISNKVIYMGNFVSMNALRKSYELGVGGILAGGVDRAGFSFANEAGIFLGIFTGFGQIPTPKFIYDVLKEVSNRYVFVQGERGLLRIPLPHDSSCTLSDVAESDRCIRPIKEGMLVQIFEKPYFGHVGKVQSIQDNVVCVILDESGEVAQAHCPNIIALA